MNHHERIVIYGLLGALLVFNGLALLGRPESIPVNAAYAAPMASPASGMEDILGPADGVELVGDDDVDNIIVRNAGGRPGWGNDPHHRAHSVAFVHIGRILNSQLGSDIYEEEREALREEIQERETEVNEQLEDLQERARETEPNTPEGQQIRQQAAGIVQEFRAWSASRQDQLAAKHLEQAYRELVSAVSVVADRMGIDLVYRFIPTDDPFDTPRVDQATMAIRLRPVLKYPTDLDITLEVMEELALEFE